jgi:hypothetical protein
MQVPSWAEIVEMSSEAAAAGGLSAATDQLDPADIVQECRAVFTRGFVHMNGVEIVDPNTQYWVDYLTAQLSAGLRLTHEIVRNPSPRCVCELYLVYLKTCELLSEDVSERVRQFIVQHI